MNMKAIDLDSLGLKEITCTEQTNVVGGNLFWGIVGMAIYDCIASGDFERGFADAWKIWSKCSTKFIDYENWRITD